MQIKVTQVLAAERGRVSINPHIFPPIADTSEVDHFDFEIIAGFLAVPGDASPDEIADIPGLLPPLTPKSVVFLVGDYHAVPEPLRDSIVFSQSAHVVTNAIPLHFWFWSREEVDRAPPLPFGSRPIDVSFTGTTATYETIRGPLLQQLTDSPEITTFVGRLPGYFNFADPVKAPLTALHNELMQISKCVLAPRGAGTTSLRFFEALRWGAIPVLVSDVCKLPLPDRIPWADLILHPRESDVAAKRFPKMLLDFLRREDAARLAEGCFQVFRDWFCREAFGRFVEASLEDEFAS